MRRGWGRSSRHFPPGKPGHARATGRRLAAAGQGSPRSGLEALGLAAWRQLSPVMTVGRGGPQSGMSGPRQGTGGRETLEWVGEQSRRRTLCSIERSPHQDFSGFRAYGFVVPRLLAPGVCPHQCGLCVAWGGPGVGRAGPAFLSTAQEINSWVWSRLFWSGGPRRALLLP